MFELPPLPYDHAALEPVISRATMRLHHGKHHKKYVETLNELLADATPSIWRHFGIAQPKSNGDLWNE